MIFGRTHELTCRGRCNGVVFARPENAAPVKFSDWLCAAYILPICPRVSVGQFEEQILQFKEWLCKRLKMFVHILGARKIMVKPFIFRSEPRQISEGHQSICYECSHLDCADRLQYTRSFRSGIWAKIPDPLAEAAVVDFRFQKVEATKRTFSVIQRFESVVMVPERCLTTGRSKEARIIPFSNVVWSRISHGFFRLTTAVTRRRPVTVDFQTRSIRRSGSPPCSAGLRSTSMGRSEPRVFQTVDR
jgi:hypothetical protein